MSIHAPLSKNKLPDLPWAGVDLQPGGVGFGEGVVYGPEKRGPTTRRHPRARLSSRGSAGLTWVGSLRLERALVAAAHWSPGCSSRPRQPPSQRCRALESSAQRSLNTQVNTTQQHLAPAAPIQIQPHLSPLWPDLNILHISPILVQVHPSISEQNTGGSQSTYSNTSTNYS